MRAVLSRGAGDRELAVGADVDGRDEIRMAAKQPELVAGGDVPDTRGVVGATGGHHEAAVGAERSAHDVAGAPA